MQGEGVKMKIYNPEDEDDEDDWEDDEKWNSKNNL